MRCETHYENGLGEKIILLGESSSTKVRLGNVIKTRDVRMVQKNEQVKFLLL